jgi:hypothetical protein
LVLPHPRLADRAFVLVPLADVAPEWVHPVTGHDGCADARCAASSRSCGESGIADPVKLPGLALVMLRLKALSAAFLVRLSEVEQTWPA